MRTFYIAEPTADGDPFATPVSSRPPSSKVSFPDSGLRNRPSSLSGNQLSFRISSTPTNETTTPKQKIPRMRSHMLSDSNPISKPWKNIKSTRAVISYWIVYFIIFLGIAGGAFQCYWNYIHVPLDKLPLCIVLDENFDNEDAVFGPGGTFLREVNMDGFG